LSSSLLSATKYSDQVSPASCRVAPISQVSHCAIANARSPVRQRAAGP
jgi:hypothetical protein